MRDVAGAGHERVQCTEARLEACQPRQTAWYCYKNGIERCSRTYDSEVRCLPDGDGRGGDGALPGSLLMIAVSAMIVLGSNS